MNLLNPSTASAAHAQLAEAIFEETGHKLPPIDVDTVDGKLASGGLLPFVFYTDPAIAELEDRLIWRPAWQVVGTLADFRNDGDYVATTVGGRYPVIVVRGDGELRGFLNVCRHRGATLLDDGHGTCKVLQCPYHAWTYGLDGQLKGVPDERGVSFPPHDKLGLHTVSVDTWAGYVFVSIEPDESLPSYLNELEILVDPTDYDYPFERDSNWTFLAELTYDRPANWKVSIENNLECYHCAPVHSGSLDMVFKTRARHFPPEKYKNQKHVNVFPFDVREDLAKHISPDGMAKLKAWTTQGRPCDLVQFTVWPASELLGGASFFGGSFIRHDPNPESPQRSTMVWRGYTLPEQALDSADQERLDAWSQQTIEEDMGIIARVQRGMNTGLTDSGPSLGPREVGVEFVRDHTWKKLRPAFGESG